MSSNPPPPMFKEKGRLFRLDDRVWTPVGSGDVTLTSNPASRAVTFCMVNDDTSEVCARHVILQDMFLEPHAASDRSLIYKAMDEVASASYWATYAIRFRTAAAATSFSTLYKGASERSPFRHPVSPQDLMPRTEHAPRDSTDSAASSAHDANPDGDMNGQSGDAPDSGLAASTGDNPLGASAAATLGASTSSWGSASGHGQSTAVEQSSFARTSPRASPAPPAGSQSWVYVPEPEATSETAAVAAAAAARQPSADTGATGGSSGASLAVAMPPQAVTDDAAATQLRAHEWLWGDGFSFRCDSRLAKHLTMLLNPAPGTKLLNLGCGAGGLALSLSSTRSVAVVGVDTDKALIQRADALAVKARPAANVLFQQVASLTDLPVGTYEGVLGLGAMGRVPADEAATVFAAVFNTLKPGGKLALCDACRGSIPNHELDVFVRDTGLNLMQQTEYGKLLSSCGFEHVLVEECTDQLVSLLEKDLKRLAAGKAQFVGLFSEAAFDDLETECMNTLKRAQHTSQRLVFFSARKPLAGDGVAAAPSVPLHSRPSYASVFAEASGYTDSPASTTGRPSAASTTSNAMGGSGGGAGADVGGGGGGGSGPASASAAVAPAAATAAAATAASGAGSGATGSSLYKPASCTAPGPASSPAKAGGAKSAAPTASTSGASAGSATGNRSTMWAVVGGAVVVAAAVGAVVLLKRSAAKRR